MILLEMICPHILKDSISKNNKNFYDLLKTFKSESERNSNMRDEALNRRRVRVVVSRRPKINVKIYSSDDKVNRPMKL